jgi:hypothetical protein
MVLLMSQLCSFPIPIIPSNYKNTSRLVKSLLGVPGDRVEFKQRPDFFALKTSSSRVQWNQLAIHHLKKLIIPIQLTLLSEVVGPGNPFEIPHLEKVAKE